MSLINREDLLKKQCSYYDYNGEKVGVVRVSDIVTAPEVRTEWRPFEFRELDEDEKEEHPSWDYIMVNSPYDEQEILVSDGKSVWEDCFFNDGTQCYLDSNRGMEGLAWMPFPKPYTRRRQ